MSEAISVKETHVTQEHHGFIRTYIFSTDHKMIGKQFLILGLLMMLLGGGLAMLIRWQLAYPERPLPIIGASEQYLETGEPQTYMDGVWDRWLTQPDEEQNWLTKRMPVGIVTPAFYNALFTMHATIMIFFVVMPILVGCFGNFLIPLMIGTRDMAFPTLNMLSFWVALLAGVIMLAGFFVPGGHASTGWTGYPPLSADSTWTGTDWGQNLWCISLIVLGVSSLMGSINYITTIINMRAPGMTWMRLPLVVWALFIVAILLLLALPVLTAALAMLLFDRLAGTTFFDLAGGGDPLLWQHLFWFFGHPEVYILILPAMGIASEILPVFCRKPIFGYKAMVYAMAAIAFLGFIVWGHHMFQSGMNPALGTTFMVSTMVIAVPSAIKTFNWLGTMWGGNMRFTTPMLNTLAFVSMFVIGGLSGIYMASTPVDIFIHDTYYIVAHIHYVVFGGSIFGIFAAIYYWFPKMFGRMMSEKLGKIHFWLTFISFNCTFFPMHILGVGGHMRRIYNPLQYEFLQQFEGMNIFITMSAFTLGTVQLIFLFNVFYSMRKGKKADDNPWQANTVEWTASTPPPHGNFATIPTVYHPPYEYSHPKAKEDWLPQTQPLQLTPADGNGDGEK
ncbi:cytochrome c oxidase subunit I [candidate division KSB1 bacterium]|nr:cytochrome c oxidase subunit I [candidate division KSB1 bacterium]NIR69310.1 cytochrome c oxidase subunit I [candidate division KSB1 bacterium]NIS22716.1 cytochrome c oxidase subunit I [candidate division KSB1 bacterium]NIT69562.1 cytochrome c oxidase subunit I [candidate division KSB1 bacterium]NIU23216.1 cytochrome c oxidase subunit I [candidate division KSB1 bacterium]